MKRTRTIKATAAILALSLAALAFARLGVARPQSASGDIDAVIAAIGAPLVRGEVSGSTVTIVAASDDLADATRSQWYGGLAAAAIAAKNARLQSASLVAEAAGSPVVDEEPFNSNVAESLLPGRPSLDQELRDLRSRADEIGAKVVRTRVVPLFGGAIDVTLQPDDVTGFLANAGSSVGQILGSAGGEGRAYLVAVVDRSGGVMLVLAFNPALGGTIGHGSAWLDPSASTDAVWGG